MWAAIEANEHCIGAEKSWEDIVTIWKWAKN